MAHFACRCALKIIRVVQVEKDLLHAGLERWLAQEWAAPTSERIALEALYNARMQIRTNRSQTNYDIRNIYIYTYVATAGNHLRELLVRDKRLFSVFFILEATEKQQRSPTILDTPSEQRNFKLGRPLFRTRMCSSCKLASCLQRQVRNRSAQP